MKKTIFKLADDIEQKQNDKSSYWDDFFKSERMKKANFVALMRKSLYKVSTDLGSDSLVLRQHGADKFKGFYGKFMEICTVVKKLGYGITEDNVYSVAEELMSWGTSESKLINSINVLAKSFIKKKLADIPDLGLTKTTQFSKYTPKGIDELEFALNMIKEYAAANPLNPVQRTTPSERVRGIVNEHADEEQLATPDEETKHNIKVKKP